MGGSIYSDDKKGCFCGGKFSEKKEVHGYNVPACSKCGGFPKKYRIKRKLPTPDGKSDFIMIRNTKEGKRIEDVIDAIYVLKVIDREIESENFNPMDYAPKHVKESLYIHNYVDLYIKEEEARYKKSRSFQELGQIYEDNLTKEGLRHKVNMCKKIKAFFNKDSNKTLLFELDSTMQKAFRHSLIETPRQADKALAELRTVCRFAWNRGDIKVQIPFVKIAKSRSAKRRVPDIEVVRQVISHVDNCLAKLLFETWDIYALRESEVQALKYKDVKKDQKSKHSPLGILHIQRHVSGDEIELGRKSITPEEEMGELTHPIVDRFEDVINRLPKSLNPEAYLFPNKIGNFFSCQSINRIFKRACISAGVEPFPPKFIRGARLSELSEITKKNYGQIREVSGHTTDDMLRNNYDNSKVDTFKILQLRRVNG